MKAIARFILFLFFAKTKIIYSASAAQCSKYANTDPRFGPDCSFSCHCLDRTEQCDDTSGQCNSGCDWNWGGPGCQYKNIGLNQFSRQIDSISSYHFADRANDQDMSTCSETDYPSEDSTRSVSPWLKIWFPQNETFREMSLITRNDSLDYFRAFKVTVEFVELSQRHDKEYFPPNQQTCYRYPHRAPERTSISVICDRPLVGNQVRIQLENKNTQLVICDFRVFAGRNLAQYRKVTLSSIENRSAAASAVDGQKDTHNWEACSTTTSQKNPYLSINLGYRGEVRSLALEKLDDENLRGYMVWADVSDVGRNWKTLHDDRKLNQVTTFIGTLVIAQQFRIVRYTNGRLSLCEVQIFGDCPNNVCGLECNKICHCRNINLEDKASGVCSAGCEDRWTGFNGRCDKECRHNEWGEGCQHRCGHCLSSEYCVASTGICPSGCSPGYQPPYCIAECVSGTYGKDCHSYCSGNCQQDDVCNKITGKCPNGCKPGYSGDRCDQDINECLKYRNICHENATCTNIDGSYRCSCKAGYEGDGKTCADINECLEYRNICHVHAICSNTDGSYRCFCNAGYKGHGLTCTDINECLEYRNICHENATCTNNGGSYRCSCNSGYQGDGKTCADINECLEYRNICHVHATCSNIDGSYRCSCNAGYRGNGQTCTDVNECLSYPRACHVHASCTNTEGSYNCTCNAGYKGNGRECTDINECSDKPNPCHIHATCTNINGSYRCDCIVGYEGDGKKCTDINECSDKPSPCHINATCTNINGSYRCDCIAGYEGDGKKCTECVEGLYGTGCSSSCSLHCATSCNHVNGSCTVCLPGWNGPTCTAECADKTYGHNCSNNCGNCKDGTMCHKENGTCSNGCAGGYKGFLCMEAVAEPITSNLSGIVGGTVGVFVVAALIIAIFVIRRKQDRKGSTKTANLKNVEKGNRDTVSDQTDDELSAKASHKPVNSPDVGDRSASSVPMFSDSSKGGRETKVALKEDDSQGVYSNTGHLAKAKSKHAVNISMFGAFAEKALTKKDFFDQQFKQIPYGLVFSTNVANKPNNSGKNRYKEMYAYDHSRVVLRTLSNEPDSDYINASMIKGYIYENTYIAAQGPIPANLNDFWRMIWEYDVRTVVMLTNLVEETKMKCVQYWGEVESTTQYGPVHVCTEREDIFAEYTTRVFRVWHEDKQDTTRTIHHFHYTSWPDKDVPISTSSLLHFWRKVRTHDENKSHIWLVHCSAGVGRTGTFVAVDVLYDQGKEHGYLDVYQCVKDLREQRVNMVQTIGQYRYLHGIMAEIFVLPSQPIKNREFSAVYHELCGIDSRTKKTKLLMEYEALADETPGDATTYSKKPTENIYSCAKQTENKGKNRYENILAANEYRPFLSTAVEGCTNYINAVYIPSYRDTHGYILTQTPMTHTVIDLCRLIHEQEVNVVLTFEEIMEEKVGKCFPEEGQVVNGPFKVSLVSEEQLKTFSLRTHKLAFQNKENSVLQVIFNDWMLKAAIPEDANRMYKFLLELQELQGRNGKKPVVAMCLNGAEKCGLVVVLLNILERARFDGEVSVPQVIRQLRIRRQQIIPNFDQYKFCYDVLQCCVENLTMYSNA